LRSLWDIVPTINNWQIFVKIIVKFDK
jgi:hypothetical protein